MDEVIRVLSARIDTVLIMDQAMEEVGENPDDWLPIFFKRTGK
jgi:type IV secretion system protein VirB4